MKRDVNLSLKVSEEEHRWLLTVAEEDSRSVSAVLRLALKDYYQRRVKVKA